MAVLPVGETQLFAKFVRHRGTSAAQTHVAGLKIEG